MVTPTSMNFDTTGTLTYSLGGNATHDQDPNEAHEKKLRMIIYVLDGYVTFIFITLGVSLNSLSMMVFNQMNRGKSSIAQYYLIVRTAFQSEIYWTVYHIYMVMVFVTVTPSIIILTLTFRITCFLRTARRERQNLRGSEQSERKTLSSSSKEEREPNIMIIMIAAKFALSDPLPMIESLIGAVAPEESPAMLALFASVGNLLVIFCNSVNFFLFYASGHRFRTECRKMFCIEEPKTPSWFESDESWSV
ncbi:unnamed protein product [Anisakis simplex]|uniref:G_PROTEIN_RECEP_F1_2 domain-containing protein n=1 Tax=Anisakis simplex TaxID=6269 RepID=A0A0M3JWK5_ANISI|nr:unnamed protein product [Anisakis simplex]